MNNIFGNLSNEGLEEAQDRLGGSRLVESGAITGKIKLAYAGKAANSNAQSVTIVLVHGDNQEYRETLWITNKDGKNSYVGKDDGKKYPLPGFTIIDDICLVTTNKPLREQETEDKIVNVYDYEQKKEIPTSVPMIVELLDKTVTLGILKMTRNKQKKNDSTGAYEDTAETRDENAIDKVFHYPSNLTVVEAKKQVQTATFYPAWVDKNTGVTQDRRTIKDGASPQAGRAGRPGAPPKANGPAAKTTSLFGNAA